MCSFASLSIWCLASIVISDQAARHQQEPTPASELPCVVRISDSFLDELVDDQIEASIPFHSAMLGGQVWGTATGRAQLTVDLEETPEEARFMISATGVADGCVSGRRSCFRAAGTVSVPFTATQVVHFDGDKFAAESMCVQSCVRARVTSVTTQHDSPIGDIIGGAAQPFVNHMIPDAERQGVAVANRYLGQFVREETTSVVSQLNQVTPLEMTLKDLYPELTTWRYRLTTTEKHLIVAFGPPGGDLPTLPTTSEPLSDARLEVWVRTTREEAAFLQSLSRWNASHDLISQFLSDDPEVAALLEDATVTAVEDWVRVGIGVSRQTSKETLPQQSVPE